MSSRYQAVKGTRDILPPESQHWTIVEQTARNLFRQYGYQEIRTPVFESRDLFVRSVGETTEVITKQMYSFQDQGGKWLALRPEGTVPVLRAFIQQGLYNRPQPYRYFYIGPMFRRERPQKGRYRQFHQIGVEVLAESSPLADAEVIAMAAEFLGSLGIRFTRLEINSIGCLRCRPAYITALKQYFGNHRDALCEDCINRLEVNPLRILDCKNPDCRDLFPNAPSIDAFLCSNCHDHFAQVRNFLHHLAVEFNFNPRLVRGLDYYMRTTFEFLVGESSAQNAVLGGGRYDGLLKELGGPDWPGIGFAIGMERLMELVPREPFHEESYEVMVIPLEPSAILDALTWTQHLRQNQFSAWVNTNSVSLRSALRLANKCRVPFVVILGVDEITSGKWTLRDMRSGEQIRFEPDSLMEHLLRIRQTN